MGGHHWLRRAWRTEAAIGRLTDPLTVRLKVIEVGHELRPFGHSAVRVWWVFIATYVLLWCGSPDVFAAHQRVSGN